MFSKYGRFLGEGEQFLINTLDIERNWYNYFFTDHYISFTSQANIGQAFLQDELGYRIMTATERGVYAVEGETGWNLAGLPVYDKPDAYECVHGLGYTLIRLSRHKIASEYGVFAPPESSPFAGYDVSWVKLTNTGDKPRSIKVISYAGNNIDGSYSYQGYNTGKLSYDGLVNGLHHTFTDSWNKQPTQFELFITCGSPLSGYDCARNAFIGTYGSAADPRAIHTGGCHNSSCVGEKFAFAVQTTVELAPGQSKAVTFITGIAESAERVNEITKRYGSMSGIEKGLAELKARNDEVAAGVKISTPDKNLDALLNNWLIYQTNLGSRWARVRHNGYRDMTSDTECLAAFAPQLAWERFKRVLTYQYASGYAPRTFKEGRLFDYNFADCAVWIAFAGYAIINELGDLSLLTQQVKFNDGSSADVYEHIRRSVEFLYNLKGHYGLVQIWGGDWNDCINYAGTDRKGVSVWLSIAWYRANRQFAELARASGHFSDAALAEKRGEQMRDLVDKYGWDEQAKYYIYAITDDFHKIGAPESPEGKIYLIPQLWAVLSGIAKDGKEVIAMESAEQLLTGELGTCACAPAYTRSLPYIGDLTKKAPGVQENGGVYLHPMAWKLAADAMLGRADLVERDMNRILPFNNPVVNGRAEPYVLCNCYMGRQTGYRYGTPGQSWRTATGQWFAKAMLQFVFGLNPTIAGLELKPCLPQSWQRAFVERRFRGCVYHIAYEKTGRASIAVDGEPISGRILPYSAGSQYRVTVTY